jgi:hypothetical protein
MSTNTERILVSTSTALNAYFSNSWERCKADIQQLIAMYSKMNIAPIENINDVYLLLTQTENFIYQKQTGGGAIMKGNHGNDLAVEPSVATRLFVKPAGYQELLMAVNAFVLKAGTGGYGTNGATALRFNPSETKKYFDFENGALKFADELQAEINDYGNCYAATEKGKAIYNFLEKMKTAFLEEKLNEFLCPFGTSDVKTECLTELLESTMSGIDVGNGCLKVVATGAKNQIFAGDQFWNNRQTGR